MSKSIPNNPPLVSLAVMGFGIVAALAVTLPHSPANMPYVQPDGGVFLYVGQRLLDGAALYRQVWDHKPPLIYFLNALALWAGQGSRWGVWVFETLAVAAATFLSVQVLRKAFGIALALVVTTIWLVTFFGIIDDGNLTETFALPLQFAVLALAYHVETHRAGAYRWRGFLMGVLLALIFFLKINQVGVGLALVAYILLKAWRARRLSCHAPPKVRGTSTPSIDLAWLLGGFLFVTAIILAILASQNSLADFWRAVFVFNVVYSGQFEFWSSRFDALAAGYGYLVGTGLIVFALLGFVVGVNALLFAREQISPSLRPLLTLCALALPIEIVLVTTSGRPFAHYFAALLYVMAVWASYFFFLLFQSIRVHLLRAPPRAQHAAIVSVYVVVLLTLVPALKKDADLAQQLHALEPPAIVRFLQTQTTPQDTVLILGHEARILFFAGRHAPTRYVNASTFQQTAFVTPEMAEEYYRDILDAQPKYIVDLIDRGLVNLTPIDSPYIRRRVGALNQQYKKYGDVGGWTVFERVATP